MPPQNAAQGANNHSFMVMDMTKMMTHNAAITKLTCIMKRACFFSFGKLMTSGTFE